MFSGQARQFASSKRFFSRYSASVIGHCRWRRYSTLGLTTSAVPHARAGSGGRLRLGISGRSTLAVRHRDETVLRSSFDVLSPTRASRARSVADGNVSSAFLRQVADAFLCEERALTR